MKRNNVLHNLVHTKGKLLLLTTGAVIAFYSCSKENLQESQFTENEISITSSSSTSEVLNPSLIFAETFEKSVFFPLSGTVVNKTHGIENCNNNVISADGPSPWTLTNSNATGRFELRKGVLTTKGDYRSEVTIIKGTEDSRFIPEMWYSYDVMMPKDGGGPAYRKSINQWYEDGSDELTTRTENGYAYLELQNSGKIFRWDLFSKTLNTSATNSGFTLYPIDEWHNFVFHIHHSLNADGFIEVFRDGVKIHNYSGPTIHTRLPKWKLGLYASQKSSAATEVIHFDNVRVGKKGVTLADMMGGSVLVSSGNLAPTANAGADKSITLPLNTVTLAGSGTDPDGTISSYLWTKVSGPTGGTISAASSASTGIAGLIEGTYIYRLQVTDNGGARSTDDVQITVLKGANIAPVVNAGIDQTITLPTAGVTLNGTATDSDGSIASIQWIKVSGPSCGISGATGLTAAISGMVEGTYVFRLTATDNLGAMVSDDVQVIVKPAMVTTTSLSVSSMTIINAVTEKDVTTIANGGTYSLSQLGITKMNIRANASISASSVKFELTGQQLKTVTDKAAPFALMGDNGLGNYYYGSWGPPPVGTYTLKATPYDAAKIAGTPMTITFTIVK